MSYRFPARLGQGQGVLDSLESVDQTCLPCLHREGAIPLWNQEVPLGYGQHWEALRNIQASYGDVMTHDEFFELIDRS